MDFFKMCSLYFRTLTKCHFETTVKTCGSQGQASVIDNDLRLWGSLCSQMQRFILIFEHELQHYTRGIQTETVSQPPRMTVIRQSEFLGSDFLSMFSLPGINILTVAYVQQ